MGQGADCYPRDDCLAHGLDLRCPDEAFGVVGVGGVVREFRCSPRGSSRPAARRPIVQVLEPQVLLYVLDLQGAEVQVAIEQLACAALGGISYLPPRREVPECKRVLAQRRKLPEPDHREPLRQAQVGSCSRLPPLKPPSHLRRNLGLVHLGGARALTTRTHRTCSGRCSLRPRSQVTSCSVTQTT
jgi:hypothetical protein